MAKGAIFFTTEDTEYTEENYKPLIWSVRSVRIPVISIRTIRVHPWPVFLPCTLCPLWWKKYRPYRRINA